MDELTRKVEKSVAFEDNIIKIVFIIYVHTCIAYYIQGKLSPIFSQATQSVCVCICMCVCVNVCECVYVCVYMYLVTLLNNCTFLLSQIDRKYVFNLIYTINIFISINFVVILIIYNRNEIFLCLKFTKTLYLFYM